MRTFSLLVLAILGFAFVACDDDDHLGDWAKAPEFSGRMRNQAVSFTIGNNVYVGLGFGVDLAEYKDFKRFDMSASTWYDVDGTGVHEFPGQGRHGAVAFTAEVNGKTYAYVGLGYIAPASINNGDGSTTSRPKEYLKDFYRYDAETNTWEQMPDFPGAARRDAVAFSLGNYGFVGTGRADNAELFKDFYRFNPATNTWSGDLGFLGGQRYGASAFVIDGAAYVCLGTSGTLRTDVTKCTIDADGNVTWEAMQALADKPGNKQDKDYGRIPRYGAITFISDKSKDGESYAYVATGYGNSTVWRYNHKRDQWHQMEDIAGSALVGAVGFSVNGYGYYTTGGAAYDMTDATSSSSSTSYSNSTWRFIPDVKEDRANDYDY